MSQSADILRHLERGRAITPMEALGLFQCFRLAARIAELRTDGHPIETRLVAKAGKRFARYSMRCKS